jgi:CheY-like chemotaxis protein
MTLSGATGSPVLEAVPRRDPGEVRRHRSPMPPRDGNDEHAGSQPWVPGRFDDAPTPRESRLPSVLRGLRVLIVDDDTDTAELFATALTACGAATSVAGTARAALQLAQETRPDVIVSDIAMAGEDGYWLVNEIRRHADTTINRVPVVAATAYGREHSRVRALAAGFMDHLRKPVDPELLCLTVARAAGRGGHGPGPSLT